MQHNFIDLTSGPQEMAKHLKGVEAEYVFFAAYLQKDTEEENWNVNGRVMMLSYPHIAANVVCPYRRHVEELP